MKKTLLLVAALSLTSLSACRSDGAGNPTPLDPTFGTGGPSGQTNCIEPPGTIDWWRCAEEDPAFDWCCYGSPTPGYGYYCWDEPTETPLSCDGAPQDPNASTTSGDPTAADVSTDTGEGEFCEDYALYSCRGYKYGIYQRSDTGEQAIIDPFSGVDAIECFDFGAMEVCKPELLDTDLTNGSDPIVIDIMASCMEACESLPEPTSIYPATAGNENVTWVLQGTECVVEADPATQQVPGWPGNLHTCGSVTNLTPQVQVVGDCEMTENDPESCPVGAGCEDWRPGRMIYAGRKKTIIDVDFWDGLDIGTLFACDANSFVYSGDGTTDSKIDGVGRDDMLYAIGLRDQDSKLEIRKTGGSWKPLKTYDDVLDAWDVLATAPGAGGTFEIRFDRHGTSTTIDVEIKQCGSSCDSRDL